MKTAIDLLILGVRSTHVRCRLLGSASQEIEFKPVPRTPAVIRTLLPGTILTVQERGWKDTTKGRRLEGTISAQHRDLAALGLAPIPLEDQGQWSPPETYWGGREDRVAPCLLPILAAGSRPAFEMQSIVPGMDYSDFDHDPILNAVGWLDRRSLARARTILHKLLEQDLRCLDAWAHLGNIAFNEEEDPATALTFYEMGVAIANLSVPPEVPWVLLWGNTENRPFLRCLNGQGLALWRLGRFEEAQAVFERILWFNPNDNQGIRFTLPQVQARMPWTGE